MEVCVFTEPQQGADYAGLRDHALAVERLGFDGWFRSDHYLRMGDHVDGLPGPTDAWTTLAALAVETSTIRLGTLVSSVTYRVPGVLAIQVAQVDAMSGGRVELGLGTGWYAAEHAAYGIPFPEKRFGMLEDQLAIVTGLWSTPAGGTFSYDGAHHRLVDSPALPKPVQQPVPVIVGGNGPRRTPQLAARYATEFNLGFQPVDATAAGFARVRAACEAEGRDPATLKLSAAQPTLAGATEAEYARRAATIGADPAAMREQSLGGTPDEIVETALRYAEAGAERLYLQVMDTRDLDHLELLAAEVLPRLR
jgi:F420-dependent oxidoreductase-like protein